MADQQQMVAVLITSQAKEQMLHGTFRREVGELFQTRFHVQRCRDDVCRLAGTQERAGENPIELDFEPAQSARSTAHTFDAFAR